MKTHIFSGCRSILWQEKHTGSPSLLSGRNERKKTAWRDFFKKIYHPVSGERGFRPIFAM